MSASAQYRRERRAAPRIFDIRRSAGSEHLVTDLQGANMIPESRALSELLEESQDLQADALRPTAEALDELV
jgi:hypothetical protein